MAKPSSISVSELSSAAKDAVQAALKKHPGVRVEQPQIALHYLICGIPVPDLLRSDVPLRDAQAFANDVAANVGRSVSAAAPGLAIEGSIFSRGGHLILGFPVPPEVLFER